RVGRATPITLALALVATLVPAAPSAWAAAELRATGASGTETAVVTLDDATPHARAWVYADPAVRISGSVTSDSPQDLDGAVELWRLPAGASSPEKLVGPVALDGGT